MLNFLIYVFIQILLEFSFLAGPLASSWNVACEFLNYTSKLIFHLKHGFHKHNPRFQFENWVQQLKSRFHDWNLDLVAEILVWRINVQNGFHKYVYCNYLLTRLWHHLSNQAAFSKSPKIYDKHLNILKTERAFFIIFKELSMKQITQTSLEGESPTLSLWQISSRMSMLSCRNKGFYIVIFKTNWISTCKKYLRRRLIWLYLVPLKSC